MRNENMYRVFVAITFILLFVIGLYIGVSPYDDKNNIENQNIAVSNKDSVKIYDESGKMELEDISADYEVKFTDIYPECGHNIETNEHHENITKQEIRDEIEDKDLGYRLIGEQEGILFYQKVHIGKCMNHYKVILENNLVVIYRINESGEFQLYQTTEITGDMLREGIKEQITEGIVVDDVEELLLLMEDIES